MKKRIQKPWGHEIIWAETDRYAGKFLHIEPNCRLSLQYHKKKEETIYVLEGKLLLICGESEDDLQEYQLDPGETFHVKPNMLHRFCALNERVTLIEVSTAELNDIERVADDYKR